MPGTNLTHDEARERAALLRVTSYAVELDLAQGAETFSTRTTVRFDAAEGATTFIDFIGPAVSCVELNGRQVDPAACFDGARIELAGLATTNVLVVDATGAYMNTGEGLHRFVDPVDGEAYLYTQFEVADARRVFAVFDQPDLKSRFTFTITAPAAWEVISTQTTPAPTTAGTRDIDGGEVAVATWEFAPTPLLSPYVTAIVAGPYASARSSLTTGDGREIPLGVFCRASLLPHLDAHEIVDCTRRGFAFYEKEFGLAYPFEKYDQIFTPEFNAGAMENVGAVTYHEQYVFRAKVPEAIIERRALTILHELAHMWFGNLVTMRWWDDLWLNESFAEWASSTCQAEATRWSSAWTTFSIAEKAWAYSQDQLSSTHPIVAEIRDLHDVEVNFDGITYAKGASVLAQLVAYVGREPFTRALRAYFATHAWGNTTLADLLSELQAASGRDMSAWSAAWLQTAGVNTLRLEVETDDAGLITQAHVLQEAPASHPTLRRHRLRIGVYDVVDDAFERRLQVELDADGARTPVPDLVGVPRGDLLLINDDDLAYAKIRLDDTSLRSALAHPRGFTDSLPRALVLGAAWDATRDAESPARDYVRLVLDTLPGETNSTMLRVLLAQAHTAATLYVAPDARAEVADLLADRLRDLARHAPAGSDVQLQLVTAYSTWARRAADLDVIDALLEGRQVWDGLDVDTEMRWSLLTALVAGGRAGEERIAAEERRDATATGRERAARARAAIPTPHAKDAAWTAAVDTDGMPNQTLGAVARGFLWVHDPALLAPYTRRYLDSLRQVATTRTYAITETITQEFYPTPLADAELLEATQAWLDDNSDAPEGLRRLVGENRDGVARALAAQKRDARA